jgi:hypothetical protein
MERNRIAISGNPDQDAKRYQERDMERAIREVQDETK